MASLSTFLLSLLLCSSLTAFANVATPPAEAPRPAAHHHHHHHHPSPAPVHPPVKPPTKPPVHPPVKAPVHPPVKPPTKAPVHPPVKPPTKPPVHPPVKPPTKPPVHPPVKPPTQPPVVPPLRKKVAVQGVVYCKACKYRGIDTLSNATLLSGAVVKLQCNNTKKPLEELKTTDKNGYFFFMPPKLTTSGSHKCKVTLVSSPSKACTIPTKLHGGAAGAILYRSRTAPVDNKLPFHLFTVGPFAFDADKKIKCPY